MTASVKRTPTTESLVELEKEKRAVYKTAMGKLLYMCQERADIMYSAKETAKPRSFKLCKSRDSTNEWLRTIRSARPVVSFSDGIARTIHAAQLRRDGCPRGGEAHSRGQAPSAPRKVHFLKGVSAAQGSPGMKFKSDMEDLTSPGRLPSQTWNVEPVTMRALSKATRHAFLSLEHQ